jgi:hypothetical protein
MGVRRKSANGGDLSRNRSGLATTEWAAAVDDTVMARRPDFTGPSAKSALIDKALTPSYVSLAARSCSLVAIPLQLPEKCRISRLTAVVAAPPRL